MIRHLLNILFWILPPSRLFLFRRICLKLAQVEIGKNVSVCGRGLIYGRGRLRIGNNTWLSPGVIVYTHLNAPIEIGSNCDIGPGVEFITGGHLIGGPSRRAGEGTAKTIVVNNGCWIGAGARILGGVSIGKGAVVAAGSLVIHNVPENVLVAGVPAVVKKKLP
jgi:maltose O-acetyltransferase